MSSLVEMGQLFTAEGAIALVTLTVLEIVLGIDNIVFISILAGKLPHDQQAKARTLGLGLAMGMRILLLFSITWIMRLTAPLFEVFGQEISGRDLILGLGGLFLIWKATKEVHDRLEGPDEGGHAVPKSVTMGSALAQIAMLDIVFSLDSVITAVGMAEDISVMVVAVVVAVGFMMFTAGTVSAFVERHPTVKMLALSFLLLIGVTLIAESFDRHIPKGYIYFSMAFAVFVEMLNLRASKTTAAPIHLRPSTPGAPSAKTPGR
ncbi:MAG TPA: TerC family protein [Bryobacteraceae bacterium]|nr:TerC family protein [Bryobacteraceae bacterium]